MPTISVVVPVYKVEQYLKRCVESILNQIYKDYELILVDDGSPDQAPEMCDQYAKDHPFIHVIHQENGGLSAARNSGIEWALNNSDSEWITFIDSDDWIHPQYLELLLDANRANDTAISMGQIYITEEYTMSDECMGNDIINVVRTEDAFKDMSLDPESSCARLFRKSLFEDIRFPIGKWHEDRFTSYRLLFQFQSVSVVNAPIYYYFENNDGITHSSWNPRKMDLLEAAENQLEFFKETDNDEMYRYILEDYIKIITRNMRDTKNKSEFKLYYKILRKKLKKTLKTHRDYLNISFKNNINIYKYAYPFSAKVYRRLFL